MGADPVEPLDWQFLQCFGERTPGEEIQEGDCEMVPRFPTLIAADATVRMLTVPCMALQRQRDP
jgi:hypothetical protein